MDGADEQQGVADPGAHRDARARGLGVLEPAPQGGDEVAPAQERDQLRTFLGAGGLHEIVEPLDGQGERRRRHQVRQDDEDRVDGVGVQLVPIHLAAGGVDRLVAELHDGPLRRSVHEAVLLGEVAQEERDVGRELHLAQRVDRDHLREEGAARLERCDAPLLQPIARLAGGCRRQLRGKDLEERPRLPLAEGEQPVEIVPGAIALALEVQVGGRLEEGGQEE
ncbi:MAG: hypothetical protein HY049_13315 [Acidobacteria bacterium]|nr:hypothetical protein [Acidobacteriota bacterium]